jgi:phosphonoacetaldehyde hydrolase
MGLKIGTNTGYNRQMVEILLEEARQQGLEPDSTVSASEVPAGRPEPWMSLLNAQQMRVFPMEAVVKVDDTIPGIEEGLNAQMWTIGLAKTGNEIGLNQTEVEALPVEELQQKLNLARQRMQQAGAHLVADGIWEVPAILQTINTLLARGEKPF